MIQVIETKFRVINRYESMGFRTEDTPCLEWFDTLEEAEKEKNRLKEEEKLGHIPMTIGYYTIEEESTVIK